MVFPCLMRGCMVYEESYPAPSAGLPLTSFDLIIKFFEWINKTYSTFEPVIPYQVNISGPALTQRLVGFICTIQAII